MIATLWSSYRIPRSNSCMAFPVEQASLGLHQSPSEVRKPPPTAKICLGSEDVRKLAHLGINLNIIIHILQHIVPPIPQVFPMCLAR